MTIYAIVSNNLVAEIFDAGEMIPGIDILTPETTAIDLTDVTPKPVVGWSAQERNGNWVFLEPAEVVLTDDQLKATAMAQRTTLLAHANERTAGMADAYIAGLLEHEEELLFKAWAAYKLALNKIDKQINYPKTIVWPILPE